MLFLVAPFRSTYLDLRLSHILWQIADDDLALPRGWLRKGLRRYSRSFAGSLGLLDTTGRCGDRGLGLGFGVASWSRPTPTGSSASSRLGVLHDLVERLVELSRHGDGEYVV